MVARPATGQRATPNTLISPTGDNQTCLSNRTSIHSLHSIHHSDQEVPHHTLDDSDDDSLSTLKEKEHASGHDEDDDDDDDDAASISTRSDQSEEAAGLVSRLSGESERQQRRARYESLTGNFNPKIEDDGTLFDNDISHTVADDDYDGHQSFIGQDGFADRRGTLGRLRRKQGTLSKIWAISRETLPILVLSLFSLVFSGELLIHLARWPVFRKVDKLFILIPILLNMKGNLEMNLSLRMSTSANIGELDIRRTRETLIRGNLALLQVQALIVSSFAGILAFILGIATPEQPIEAPAQAAPFGSAVTTAVKSVLAAIKVRRQPRHLSSESVSNTTLTLLPRGIIHHSKPSIDPALKLRNGYFEFVLVIATGMLSASLSSAILGSFMCALVIVSRRTGANPDNIACPLAASLGDLTTLTLLALLASFLVRFEGTILATLILACLAVACIACFIVTYRNAYVRELLTSGWVPLFVAMLISSVTGLVLDAFVQKYQGFALLSPVVTGLPGAIGAIFASRITTALHSGNGNALLRSASKAANVGGIRSIFASVRAVMSIPPIEGWLVPCTLLLIGVLIKVVFVFLIKATGQMSFGIPFTIFFLVSSIISNFFSLFLAHSLCLVLWSRDFDPDIYCLPLVSSLVDVIGQSLLVAAFALAQSMGDHVTASVHVVTDAAVVGV